MQNTLGELKVLVVKLILDLFWGSVSGMRPYRATWQQWRSHERDANEGNKSSTRWTFTTGPSIIQISSSFSHSHWSSFSFPIWLPPPGSRDFRRNDSIPSLPLQTHPLQLQTEFLEISHQRWTWTGWPSLLDVLSSSSWRLMTQIALKVLSIMEIKGSHAEAE